MKIVQTLICYGLRQVMGEFADTAVDFVVERFTDESKALPKAIVAANERTWEALAAGLAGDSFLDGVKRCVLGNATECAIREQLKPFLQACAVKFAQQPEQFRNDCLQELNRLRASKALKDHLPAAELKRQLASWKRYADPPGVIEGARKAVSGVALVLEQDYPKLSRLLRQRMKQEPPLLAALFSFFLQQEIAGNAELSRALNFNLLRKLYAQQEAEFAGVGHALDMIGDKLDTILDQLSHIEEGVNRIGGGVERIEGGVGRIESDVTRIEAAVLDILAELQRNQNSGPDVCVLFAQIIERLDKQGMQRGVLRPGDSSSMQSDEERAAVRVFKQHFRQLPPEQQRQIPALLNGLGKLQQSAGDFAEARISFATAIRIAPGDAARAEVFFNDYRSALELRDYGGAFVASQQAAVLDPGRFSLFPAERYTPQCILGAGGFGAAFLCQDENFERLVVVKTLHTHDQLERPVTTVFDEAITLSGLSHPAIIKAYDGDFAFKDAANKRKERPYIVMEYFPGVSLKAYVEKNGGLKPHEYLAIAKQIVSGMTAAHRHGVWHRDLKPDNILVLREGDRFVVKIIDFGLALRRSLVETSAAKKREPTVLGDSAAGTRHYSAPEQMDPHLGIHPGPYSDVYAFGKMSWFALFKTTMPRETQKQTVPELAALLDKCTKEHPEDRYPNFEAVASHLDGGEDQRKQRTIEGEMKLVEVLRGIFDRSGGKEGNMDMTAAKVVCRQYGISKERGQEITRKSWQEWQKDYRRKVEPLLVPPPPPIPERQPVGMEKVWQVDPSGRSDFRTLEEAIAKLPAGAKIRLVTGTHRLAGPLSLTKALTLMGEGMDRTRIVGDGEKYVVKFSTDGLFSASDLAFVHEGNRLANVVEVDQGEISLVRCRFTGSLDQETGRGGEGLWLHGASRGQVEACEMVGNGSAGIFLSEQAQPTLEANTCRQNTGAGIAYFGSAAGTARNNTCAGNEVHGIYVSEQAQPALTANTCRQNLGAGIAYFGSAAGMARNNSCAGNETSGIKVSQLAAPTLEANACRANNSNGIDYFGSAAGTARNNTCAGNESSGIYVHEQAQPTLAGNTCLQNLGDGIGYSDSAAGTARNNTCAGNEASGIYLDKQAQPTLEANTCRENKGDGITYLGSAGGTARNNTCAGNEASGIFVSEQAHPTLEANTCQENKRHGIGYSDSAAGTARNNTCAGNESSGIFVDKQAQPTLEANTCRENEGGIAYFGSAAGTARNNTCAGNESSGIFVDKQAQPTLEANTCRENKGAGITYLGSAGGTARNNTCAANKKNGIYVGEQAQPTLEANTCLQNKFSGIGYSGSAVGTVLNNSCARNETCGISVSEEARPTLEANTCRENKEGGIAYIDSAAGMARNNTCADNEKNGIYVGEQAQPTLEANTCAGNAASGICLSKQARPTLEANVCRENKENGIAYYELASASARNNRCFANGKNGVYVASTANPRLVSNRCSGNEGRDVNDQR